MLVAIKKYPLLFVFAILTTVLLGFLGNWQYQKGQQREIDDAIKLSNLDKQVINLNDMTNDSILADGIKVRLTGHFISDKILFHDNRLNQGKSGYHVLSIFVLDNNRSILVNRGWVLANFDRRILPEVSTSKEKVTISGIIRFPVKNVYTLAEESENKHFPQRLQTIDVDRISKTTGYDLEQYSVLLDQSVDGDHYDRNWQNLLPGKYMTADKHYAYSLQWYSLAVVGLIVFMILIYKMAHNEER